MLIQEFPHFSPISSISTPPSGPFPSAHKHTFVLKQTRKQTSQHIHLHLLPLTPVSNQFICSPEQTSLKGPLILTLINVSPPTILQKLLLRLHPHLVISSWLPVTWFPGHPLGFLHSLLLAPQSPLLLCPCVLASSGGWCQVLVSIYTHSCGPLIHSHGFKFHLPTNGAPNFTSNWDFSPILIQILKYLLAISTWMWKRHF